jgi:NADH-quinone oxidoreductase subunit J
MNITINDGVFVIISGLIILSALGVVFSRNIIHSALFLVLAFLGVAGIFFELDAGFLGLVQILVYAGAISVLIIFAIMLVMNVEAKKTNLPNPSLKTHLWGIYLAALLTIALGASIWNSELPQVKGLAVSDAVGSLAELMLGNYVVAFEVAAVLLLLAVVGAIILARGVEEE